MFDAAPVAAASTIIFTSVLAKFAPALGLLDIPDERKRHEGNVPIVGGLAIGLAYLIASTLLLPDTMSRPVVDAGILLLLCVGAVDDRIALRPRWKLLAQCAVALALVVFGGLKLTSFGNLFGFGEVSLAPMASVLFTIFFIVSLINGFNMLDGLDGLAGGVGAIMLGALCFGALTVGAAVPIAHMTIFVAGLLGFLLLHNINSPLRRRLVFLGDAGSMVLGFVLAWSAIRFTQHSPGSIYPISIVWIFGMVVLDTIATVIRRLLRKRNPLSPGRDHLHHLLLELGMTPQRVAWLMYAATGIMAAVGLAGWIFRIDESMLTFSFVALSAVYYVALSWAWRRVDAQEKVSAGLRILFLTDNFPPETNAPASRTFEHARRWVRAGHRVTVMTCAPNFPKGKVYPGYRNAWKAVEMMEGIRVVRVKTYITANSGFFGRTLDYMSFMLSASLFGLRENRPDVVIGTSPQLFTVVAAWFLAAVKRAPFVFELRDLWPESIASVGAAKNRWMILTLERLVHWLYQRADSIVSVTQSFKKELVSRGIEPDKIVVIRNGVDLDRFSASARDKALADKWGVSGKFVAGYFGTHGMAHGLDNILEAAEKLQHREDIAFVLLGDGAEKERLVEKARSRDLKNVVFLDSVSKDEMPAAWSVCDLALVHLKNDPLFSKVIPSKIFEASGAGRAVLLALPEGEAADLVREYSMGEWIPPAEPDVLAARVAALADDPLSLARYARHSAAASVHFSRDTLAGTMLSGMRALAAQAVPVSDAASVGNVRALPVPAAIHHRANARLFPDEDRLDRVASER